MPRAEYLALRSRAARAILRPVTSAAESANQSAKQVAQSRPVKLAARVGLLSYGVTHLLIAWIALQIAFGGGGGEKADQGGAFQALAAQPLGRTLLWVLTIGFVAVALWRLEQAIWGYRYVSDTTEQLRKRAVSGGKVVIFAVLAVLAGRAAGGGGGGGAGQQQATAGLLGLPGGQFIVGAVGLGVIVAGGAKVYAGWEKTFRDDMDLPSDRRARMVAERTGQVGFIAKGLATALIGVLIVIAAWRFDPKEAAGLDSALKSLAAQPFGPFLLAAVAIGLACYGVFCFFDARYHRV